MKTSLRPRFLFIAASVVFTVCSSVPLSHQARAASAADVSGARKPASPPAEAVVIPGPLRSFQRMAGISQQASADEVLPLLARNIFTLGYEQGRPTEYLLLIGRYLQQARELQILATPSGTIKVTNCDDAGTLIHILGYRLRPNCGQKNFSLETANATRAFLTIDSGFPLVDLEESLQNGTPFTYAYPSSPVPVLFRESDWAALRSGQRQVGANLVDVLLSDPAIARLYSALANEDTETRQALQQAPGLRALLPYADVLDFYGGQLRIRSGRVAVPGGADAELAWKELVGASPDSPRHFVPDLLARDRGWMAAYFDTLFRVSPAQQAHLTETPRLRRLYDALRPTDKDVSATHGVFRKAPDLLVLFSRIQWEPNGDPHIPGDVESWKEICRQKTTDKAIREVGKRARSWERPEQLFEGMTSLSSVETDIGPLQMFLTAIEIDRHRPAANRISAETMRLLARKYAEFNAWYSMFTEFPTLDDISITRFVNVADAINRIPNQTLRENAEGSFQASVGLWQILARQGEIPDKDLNASWMKLIGSFDGISSPVQLFDSTRSSLEALLTEAGGSVNDPETQVVDLLAGPRQESPDGQHVHQELAGRINSVLEDQRLVSLNTLFTLSDGLKDKAQTGNKEDNLLPLAAELREFDLPQPIFTHSEKISWAPPIFTEHHAELQVKTDLTKVIKGPASRAQLETARGQLAPFLRDTLVGLNYAYYEPPDAQMLHHNPLFVRSHDFLGISILGSDRLWGAPRVSGIGTPAGGGAYLMGSLSDLPYALATTEQDFIAPKNIQALIWREVVPVLLASATIPRWWNITPNEFHAVTLYQRSGEELLTASAGSDSIRTQVIDILSDRLPPQRLEEVEKSLLRADDARAIVPLIEPSATFYLAAEYRRRFPDEAPTWGPASQQLEQLRNGYPAEVSWARISRDFGVPHPTLAQSNACELLNVKPFPIFGSYSSRLFGESWDSNNLYWARLADEMGYSPAALNSLVPKLTRRMIVNIFATDIEDWPAVQRAMRETGDEFRQGRIAPVPALTSALQASQQAGPDTIAR
jgi:hypothetical protein